VLQVAELSGQANAHAAVQAAQQAHPACTGGGCDREVCGELRIGRSGFVLSHPCAMKHCVRMGTRLPAAAIQK